MRVYECDPNVELIGFTARALLENLNAEQIKPFLDAHRITEIDPEQWYKVKNLLAVLNDILRSGASAGNFVAIGMKAVETTPMPPELAQLAFGDFLMGYSEVYKQLHRNGDGGTVWTEKAGKNHYVVHFDVPYPDDIMYGVLFAYARHFLSSDTYYVVSYDEEVATRDQGGDDTLIHVTWEE